MNLLPSARSDDRTGSPAQPRPEASPRIYYLHPPAIGGLDAVGGELDRVRDLGFTHLLLSPGFEGVVEEDPYTVPAAGVPVARVAALAGACRDHGLELMLDVAVHRFAAGHPLAAESGECFDLGGPPREGVVDPRRPAAPRGAASPRLQDPRCAERLLDWAGERLRAWTQAGVGGYRLLQLDAAPPAFWRGLIGRARELRPDLLVLGDSPGLARETVQALAGCGFDRLVSSLAWWDLRAPWLVEEHEALRAVAPLVASLEPPFGVRLARRTASPDLGLAYERMLRLAAATGAGILAPHGFEAAAADPLGHGGAGSADLSDAVVRANRLNRELARFGGEMRQLSSPGARVTALLRVTEPDARVAEEGLLVLANPDLHAPAPVDLPAVLAGAPAEFEPFTPVGGAGAADAPLAPGEVRILYAPRARPIAQPVAAGPAGATAAAAAPRIAIEAVSPSVEGGFPAKRTVGDAVRVEADVFGDGHEVFGVELRWRPLDEPAWSRAPMHHEGNDRWSGEFVLERLGRYEFAIEAWLDVWSGFVRDLTKKMAAGVDIGLDLQEGVAMVAAARDRSSGELQRTLAEAVDRFHAAPVEDRGFLLTSSDLHVHMSDADERRFRVRTERPQRVDAERLAARYASWYELFPRSMSDDPARHGTFDDVIARLPAVRDMGFDVLYFPPIHPIGVRNRKGRNNSLTAKPGDPGSPYAIGSDDGGHDAIHPELGTLEDFRRLVAAAREHGLEIALDFAIQCSPDHPWLKQHPGWFAWRPDGSMRYAENPPKKYEDIVNVDFYGPDAVPGLWLALRDVVLHWVNEGVRTFRVDNPHTKPLPFWEWMIGEVRAAHPDVIFLSEAFTRPKVMYRLAKVGFSQSYTYFTWRHTKQEFIDYLTELTTTAPKEFFRPHFFVNTPDINPYFLQTSGRSGFLIRAALAATLSGLFGVYSGFELLESDPVPGKEEYRDSEKYEVKPRDWRRPGNIIAEITQLNRIRRSHPALQTHLGVKFYAASGDQVLFYGKRAPGADDMVLVAVNLDPHAPQEADVELPLWEWGLPDDGALEVEDLLGGGKFAWRGKAQRVRLDTDRPYAIWRVQPRAGADLTWR